MERKIVTVKYLKSNRGYAYYTLIPVEKGDMVVVEARDSHTLAIVKQTENINPDDAKWASKYIISTVDFDAHEERLAEME